MSCYTCSIVCTCGYLHAIVTGPPVFAHIKEKPGIDLLCRMKRAFSAAVRGIDECQWDMADALDADADGELVLA